MPANFDASISPVPSYTAWWWSPDSDLHEQLAVVYSDDWVVKLIGVVQFQRQFLKSDIMHNDMLATVTTCACYVSHQA